ncbi:roadblock/LC7 domain-containing protein [Zoogloea sp.]|jgi:hypothetical protein|uniref:roadblock/LC7 domain-containing protein n=1 Tax=Zoogloea sp. TaxID=49181 RepID=UPI0035B163E6
METPRRHYLLPTPAGAYFAAAAQAEDRLRGFIRLLFAQPTAPAWNDEDDGFVRRLASVGWIQYLDAPRCAPRDTIETALQSLLPPLSGNRCAVLADAHGFHLAGTGFSTAQAESLAALSADLASLYNRHRRLIGQDLRMYGSAWSIPDAAGHSQIGFWPLYVGSHRFVLILAGVPHLNQPELVDLVWLLHQRYGPLASALPAIADSTLAG